MHSGDEHKKRLDDAPQPIFFARKAFEGKNSEIREHHYPDGSRFVVTRLGSRKGGFSFEDAHRIVNRVQRYHDQLSELRVPVPPLTQLYVEYEPSIDRSVVVKSSPWVGDELYSIIRNADPEKDLGMIDRYVRAIAQVIANVAKDRVDTWHTATGIDPHTSNFVVDDRGKVWYVDLFPPRIREDGVPLVEWPVPQTSAGQALGHFKHFDVRGIILTALQHLGRAKPELGEYFKEIMLSELKTVLPAELYEPFVDELMNTPLHSLRKLTHPEAPPNTREELTGLIRGARETVVFDTPYSASLFREIALALAGHGAITLEELDTFFHNSHCEDSLPAETADILEAYLLEKIAERN